MDTISSYSSAVERIFSKDEVVGSNPARSKDCMVTTLRIGLRAMGLVLPSEAPKAVPGLGYSSLPKPWGALVDS